MVLPRLVRQARDGDDLTVHGDGPQTRCFCHVPDVIEALLGLLGRPAAVGGVCNIGGGREVSIWEPAELVIARTGSASGVRLVPYDRAYGVGHVEVLRRVPDTTRVRTLLGWRPARSLTATVDEVIEHVRDRRMEVPTPPRSVGTG